ncbi:MAG: PD40 domain-containing protein [Anaerolineae bacterium]|nr:PD40 domain-containing protein [Anaerolineae bacterium]
MKQFRLVVLSLCLATAAFTYAGPAPAQTQAGDPLLLALIHGDIWAWDGAELAQLTTWGYNERPVISPDGRYFAYNSWSSIFVEAGNPFVAGDDPPSNIWIGDLETGDFTRVSEQPADAGLISNREVSAILRSTPAWSPDGRRLVWSEVELPDYTYRIAGYDLDAGTTQVLVSSVPAPFNDAGVRTIPVWWGPGGIVTQVIRFTEFSLGEPDNELWLFDGDGGLQSVVNLGAPYIYPFGWTTYNGKDYMGVFNYQNLKIGLVDPVGGTVRYVEGRPALRSRANPLNALSVEVRHNSDDAWDVTAAWQAPWQETPLDVDYDLAWQHKIAPSPAAQAVAYIAEALYIRRPGDTIKVPGTEGIAGEREAGVAWGAVSWAVAGAGVACPGAPPARLVVGMEARVVPNPAPNVIRSEPNRTSSSSAVIGQISGGETFTVLDGPRCADGLAWWLVDYQGTTGWTAEGEGDEYWLEPLP